MLTNHEICVTPSSFPIQLRGYEIQCMVMFQMAILVYQTNNCRNAFSPNERGAYSLSRNSLYAIKRSVILYPTYHM